MSAFNEKIKKILSAGVFLILANFVLAYSVLAISEAWDGRPLSNAPDTNVTFILKNPTGIKTFKELVEVTAKAAAEIGITVAAVFIIYSGLLFVTARGSDEQLKKAKETFMWTIIGTAVLLGAWIIAQAVQGTVLGIKGS